MAMDPEAKPILVVEDESQVGPLVKVMLAEQGFDVIDAQDETGAVRDLGKRKGKVAMLVTDVDMGRMGGLEFARSVRSQYPDLPVLFVSGLPMAANELEEAASGSILVTKPFDVATLTQAVRKLMGD